MPTSLESIPELNAHLPKLAKLGIRSLEEAMESHRPRPNSCQIISGLMRKRL